MGMFEAIHERAYDDFFTNQPSKDFVEELKKPLHSTKPLTFDTRQPDINEIDLRGMYLCKNFEDKDNVLKTAYDDFETFLKVYEIGGDKCKISLNKADTSCFEEYRINISNNGITIESGDTEGIRRALVWLEDAIIVSEAPFLPETKVTKRPIIKSRITRGFFSPTNRPPLNIDELWDDVDYYPNEYLNRLAHDGNNGIWIYTRFKDLIPSDIIPEYGEGSERRIAKLKKVVQKCAKYGIKVYVFAVEPGGFTPEMREKYPDITGSMGFDKPAFCTRSERGREYCIESVERLFTMVPDLGGYLNITAGERVTSCPSAGNVHQCPRCSKYSRGENLAYTVDLICEGMRRAGAKGEFISWTYGQRVWDFDQIHEYVRKAPPEAKLMQNFEDYGFAEQLGKTRFAEDYWLSYPGPSYLFEETAKTANKYNKHLYAKMQVCCSHELATVPYIPVPGLVFRKYAGAYKHKVEGILQCWYFGNYPSIMSKAAGLLSFADDFSDERAFLVKLAGVLYGKSHAEGIADAWEAFASGYENYPLNIMFSYYGPMHDGVAWQLQLKPKNKTLPRTWLLPDKPDGDRIGDCLRQSHTIEETIELCEKICANWEKGLKLLPKNVTGEMETLSASLGIMFKSGTNIMKFYKLRNDLGYGYGNPAEILGQLKNVVLEEIKNTHKMIVLCQKDLRLGYHSEAEGFKFFPAKLEYRITKLKELLETEFVEVEERINQGKCPLAYYAAEGEDVYVITGDKATAKCEKISDTASFVSYCDKENIYLDVTCGKEDEVLVCFEHKLMTPDCEIVVNKEGEIYLPEDLNLYVPLLGDNVAKEFGKYKVNRTEKGVLIALDREKAHTAKTGVPFKLCLKVNSESWVKEENPVYNLGRHLYSAGEFGWMKIED